MEQLRMVDTPWGTISYFLVRKKIKNLNLRISRRGQVLLSVPLSCKESRADAFVREKGDWILRSLEGLAAPVPALPPQPEGEQCRQLLEQALDRVYPLVQPLGVAYPRLKLRRMCSQWGNCHWRQGYITLNTALGRCPQQLRDYVALHELVHFLQPNHGPLFYAQMDRLMPRWREYRRELKNYAAAIRD